jgi:hypothetical protein
MKPTGHVRRVSGIDMLGRSEPSPTWPVGIPTGHFQHSTRALQLTMSCVGAKATYQTSPSRWLWPESRRAMRIRAASRSS